MATTIKALYTASATITCTLASLATSSTFIVGREATWISNTSNLFDDVLVSGKITVGTTPTINTQIIVYAVGVRSSTPTYPDTFTGTDSGVTLTSAGVGRGFLKPLAVLDVDAATSNVAYYFASQGLARLFGGNMPSTWGLFITHNGVAALHATGGNHVITYEGVHYQNV